MLVSESVASRKACAYTRVHIGKHSCTAAIAEARSIAGAQARSGWIRGTCGKTCGWLIKRRGVQLHAVMTARSRAARSRHITGTSWHSNGILHDAVTRSASSHTHRGYSFPWRRSFVPLGLGPARAGLVEALVKVTGPQTKPRNLNLRR